MAFQIKETRNHPISGVIITPNDIRKIASAIEEGAREFVQLSIDEYPKVSHYRYWYDNLKPEDREEFFAKIKLDESKCSYVLQSQDGSTYSSDDISILSAGYLEDEIITSISISYRNDKVSDKASILFKVYHSVSSYTTSELSVEGTASNWTNGVYARLKKIVDQFEKQNNLVHKFGFLIHLVFSTLAGYVFFAIVVKIYDSAKVEQTAISQSDSHNYVYMSVWLAGVILGGFPAFYLLNLMKSAWPRIEIKTGKEYMQSASKKRKALIFIATAFVIPIVLEFGLRLF